MNLRILGFLAIASAVLAPVSLTALAETPQYGPWMPLKDGMQNGVEIAFKLSPDGTQYFKLLNTYKVPVNVSCKFSFETRDGKTQTDSGCNANNLAPGAQATGMGMFDFGVASVDPSSLTAKVKLLGTPAGGSNGAVPPTGGGKAPAQQSSGQSLTGPQGNTIVANPSREGVGAVPTDPTGDLGTCKVGAKATGLPDGKHPLPGLQWEERAASNVNQCPAGEIAGTRIDKLAVYRQSTTYSQVIKNGVVTGCVSSVQTQFSRCIPASEGKNYPKKGFRIRTSSVVMGNDG
jgi:hypothetical protein